MAFLPGQPAAPDPASQPFLVTEGGEITTAFENAGIVNESPTTAGRRELSATLPWIEPLSPPVRKLTHFRAAGMGDPMWSGACVYDVAGASPSVSEYDDLDVNAKDDGLNTSVRDGTGRESWAVPPSEPTPTRRARVAAQRSSVPAAAFFQGFANLHWSGLLVGWVKTPVPRLHVNFNPAAMGTKELHKATQYRPVPPMGSIVGYFGSNEKAL